MNLMHSRDGENPTYQLHYPKRSEGMDSVYTTYSARSMDHDLALLFADFKLEDASSAIADSLGVRMISDFNDVEDNHLVSVCNNLSLKPVQETRLRRLVQWVHSRNSRHDSNLGSRAEPASMLNSDSKSSVIWNQQGQFQVQVCESCVSLHISLRGLSGSNPIIYEIRGCKAKLQRYVHDRLMLRS